MLRHWFKDYSPLSPIIPIMYIVISVSANVRKNKLYIAAQIY